MRIVKHKPLENKDLLTIVKAIKNGIILDDINLVLLKLLNPKI